MMLGIDKVFKRLFGIKVEVVANVPVEKAFDCVADIARHGEWLIWGTVERASEGPVGVGSTFTYTPPMPPARLGRARLKVREFVPDERVAWEWEQMGFRLRRFFELQPADAGTRITYGEEWLHLGLLHALVYIVLLPWLAFFWVSMALTSAVAAALLAVWIMQLPAFPLLLQWHRRRCLRRIESRVMEP